MFRNALFATDLSPASDEVLRYLRQLRPLGCREVLLTYVLYAKHTVGLADMIREDATPRLEEQKHILESEGFNVAVETPVGVPGPAIARVALEQRCSLIVVGSHGHSIAREVALGSVATDIVHRSTVPVLVVRLRIFEESGEPVCRPPSGGILDHVLYATDFSDSAERAFRYVEKLVEGGCRRVTLLHVREASKMPPDLTGQREDDRTRLDGLRESLLVLGAEQVDIHLPFGTPAKVILSQASEACPSLIVVGTHSRGFASDLFLGSVSHEVVRHAASPVLLVR